MSLTNYLAEKEQQKYKNILIVTEKNFEVSDDGKHFTIVRIEEECKKIKIDCHTVFVDGYFIKSFDKKRLVMDIFDSEDEKKEISVNPSDTAIIVRGNFMDNQYGYSLFAVLKKINIKIYNSLEVIRDCANKYLTYLKLKDFNIKMPKTTIVTHVDSIDDAVKSVGGKFPIIIKTLSGAEGIGVTKADSIESLKSILQLLWKLESTVLIQEFFESKFDIRTIFIDGEYIASMKRTNSDKDFRSNKALGGEVKEYKLSEKELSFVKKVNDYIDGFFTGIDFILVDGQPCLIEINSSSGTEGIEKATKKNIVKILLDKILNDKGVY